MRAVNALRVLLAHLPLVRIVLEHARQEAKRLLAVAQLERRSAAQRHRQHARLAALPRAVRRRRLHHPGRVALRVAPFAELRVAARGEKLHPRDRTHLRLFNAPLATCHMPLPTA